MAYENETVSISSKVAETYIGTETKFKGSVKTDKPFKIDGAFEGDIESTSDVYVSEGAKFIGTLVCENLYLRGYGEGTVTCSASIDIAAGGEFKGDVTAKNVIMVEGSALNGSCKMLR